MTKEKERGASDKKAPDPRVGSVPRHEKLPISTQSFAVGTAAPPTDTGRTAPLSVVGLQTCLSATSRTTGGRRERP